MATDLRLLTEAEHAEPFSTLIAYFRASDAMAEAERRECRARSDATRAAARAERHAAWLVLTDCNRAFGQRYPEVKGQGLTDSAPYGILSAMHDEPFNLLGVSPDDWAQSPESVQLAFLSLLDIVRTQSGRLRELETLVRELQAKLGQSSRNSSKPPSSDPPSAPPAPPRPARGRKVGGQVGHDGHQRPLVPPDQVHDPIELQPQHCPTCQTALPPHLPDAAPLRRTQVEKLPPLEPIITEYRQHTVCCPACQHLVTAVLPADAPPGACGPRATALIALLRGRYRLSLDDVVEFLADVCQLPLSSASIVRGCERVSEALEKVDAAIQEAVQTQPQVNVDETGWPTETRTGWLWVAFSAIAVCFRVCTGRGQDELRNLLGSSYRGIVSSDRLSAYKLLPNGQRQLCWSHLLRNLLGLQERYADESGWAQQMLERTDELFFAWHAAKEGWFDQVALQQALIPVRLAMHELLRAGVDSGSTFNRSLSAAAGTAYLSVFRFFALRAKKRNTKRRQSTTSTDSGRIPATDCTSSVCCSGI